MNIFSIIIFSITSCILSAFLKKYNPEISILISVLAGVLIFSYIIIESVPIFNRLNYFFSFSNSNRENIELLIKSLGICFITQFTCDVCDDSGQKSISGKVELAGKFSIIIICMPIFTQIINLISGILNR